MKMKKADFVVLAILILLCGVTTMAFAAPAHTQDTIDKTASIESRLTEASSSVLAASNVTMVPEEPSRTTPHCFTENTPLVVGLVLLGTLIVAAAVLFVLYIGQLRRK